ncbi:MAG: hypothetical protein CSB28_02330 [Desulfobacterales bacterium]|nr:MAG: hypothetical protein CSB28_02330 [Desulfobacterales bacterium]
MAHSCNIVLMFFVLADTGSFSIASPFLSAFWYAVRFHNKMLINKLWSKYESFPVFVKLFFIWSP